MDFTKTSLWSSLLFCFLFSLSLSAQDSELVKKSIFNAIQEDARHQDMNDTIYITLHSSFNLKSKKLKKFKTNQKALLLFLNHLSRANNLISPESITVSIEGQRVQNLLFRVHPSQFGWQDVWNELMTGNPYPHKKDFLKVYQEAQKKYEAAKKKQEEQIAAEKLKMEQEENGSESDKRYTPKKNSISIVQEIPPVLETPIFRNDWLISTFSKSENYYTLLGVSETTREALEKRLLGRTASEHIQSSYGSHVIRSVITQSNATKKELGTRILERIDLKNMYDGNSGSYHVAYSLPKGMKIKDKTLGPKKALTSSEHTAMLLQKNRKKPFAASNFAISYTLPNGLMAFALADAQGKIIKKKADLKHSPYQSHSSITPGLSCFQCHASGTKSQNLQNPLSVSTLVKSQGGEKALEDGVRRLYRSKKSYTKTLKADAKLYLSALENLLDENFSPRKGNQALWRIGNQYYIDNQLTAKNFIRLHGKEGWSSQEKELARWFFSYAMDKIKSGKSSFLGKENDWKKLANIIDRIIKRTSYDPRRSPQYIRFYYVVNSDIPSEIGARVKYLKKSQGKNTFKFLTSLSGVSLSNQSKAFHLLDLAPAPTSQSEMSRTCHDRVCVGQHYRIKDQELTIAAAQANRQFVVHKWIVNGETVSKETLINFDLLQKIKNKEAQIINRLTWEVQAEEKRKAEERRLAEIKRQQEIAERKRRAAAARAREKRRDSCYEKSYSSKTHDYDWNGSKCIVTRKSPEERCRYKDNHIWHNNRCMTYARYRKSQQREYERDNRRRQSEYERERRRQQRNSRQRQRSNVDDFWSSSNSDDSKSRAAAAARKELEAAKREFRKNGTNPNAGRIYSKKAKAARRKLCQAQGNCNDRKKKRKSNDNFYSLFFN